MKTNLNIKNTTFRKNACVKPKFISFYLPRPLVIVICFFMTN